MATYGELFLRDYGIVEEGAYTKGIKIILSNDAKDGSAHLSLANKLKKQKKYKEAIKEYEQSKSYYKKVEQSASKIEDDTVWTWVYRLLVTPPIVSIMQIGLSDLEFESITRSSTVNFIKSIVRSIDTKIAECKHYIY